jgi:Taurine catabolism dioxygenase TauD, TfdA family
MEAAPIVADKLPETSPVRATVMTPGDRFPLVVSPATAGGTPAPPAAGRVDIAAWAAENRAFLVQSLYAHGALLFRGFGLATAEDFERVASAIVPELFGEYGDLPREGASSKVYCSTPYPADKSILFHNESSHLPRWPLKQFFFCVKASETGGETPLLDCREVARVLDRKIFDPFAAKGLVYVRNFCEGIDVSWQDFFKTTDKSVVEKVCKDDGMECEWVKGRQLRIKQRGRAVAKHPVTGDTVFFNQVQLHHPYCIDPKTRKSLVALFKEEGLPRNVYYGDGSRIEDATMAELDKVFWKTAKAFPWQSGDIVMLDNMLVAHARKPFTGTRKIVVAMGEMMNAVDLPS